MELKLSSHCSNDCRVCKGLEARSDSEMPTIIALESLKRLSKQGNELRLCGGDPLLRPELAIILDAAERLRFKRIKIYTPAHTFANGGKLSILLGRDIEVEVPFFSHSPSRHDAISGVKGSFLKSLSSLRLLKINGISTSICYTLSRQNAKDFSKALEFFSTQGVKSMSIRILGELAPILPDIRQGWNYSKQSGISLEFLNYKRELSILLNHMLVGPIVTQFETTNTCNHACVFCYHHSPHLLKRDDPYFKRHGFDPELVKRSPAWHRQRIDFAFIKQRIREAAQTGCDYIQLGGGGEPFTHPDLMGMLRFIKKLGLKAQVFTNFTLPTTAQINELVELGVDVIEVNVSATQAPTYSKIHTVPEQEFTRLVRKLDYIAELKKKLGVNKPEVRIMNPICSLNYKELCQMVHFAKQHGAAAVYFGHLQTTPLTRYLLLSKRQILEARDLVKRAISIAASLGIKENLGQFLDLLRFPGSEWGSHTREVYNRVGCLMPFYETQIHLDGMVAPCCLHPTIFSMKGYDFAGMWNSSHYKQFREKALKLYRRPNKPPLCRGCRMCVYQEDLKRFYNALETQNLTQFLTK